MMTLSRIRVGALRIPVREATAPEPPIIHQDLGADMWIMEAV